MVTKTLLYDGNLKTLTTNDLRPEAWTSVLGDNANIDGVKELYRAVPWLFRGIRYRANAVASMPFVIKQGDTIIDKSTEYTNAVGFFPDPQLILWKIEAALGLIGKAYLFNEKNLIKTKNIRWAHPDTIKPVITKEDGLTGWKRSIGGQQIPLELEDVIYFWDNDIWVEIGEPKESAGLAAMHSAGVLASIDEFAKLFFDRGAVKATILSVPGATPPKERARLSNWFTTLLSGVKNAYRTEVVNADEVKATVIGEGLKELQNTELTKEKREDIATALGVPQSILFSHAANYATAKIENEQFYTMTVTAEVLNIQTGFSRQLFEPNGYTFQFLPEALEVFQEEEVNRSEALRNLALGGIPPYIGGQILGFDLPEGMTWADVEAEVLKYAQLTKPAGLNLFSGNGQDTNGKAAFANALTDWENHATKAIKEGKSIKLAGEFDHGGTIPDSLAYAISGALKSAETIQDVRRAFRGADNWKDYP